jgi:hypothetical protein
VGGAAILNSKEQRTRLDVSINEFVGGDASSALQRWRGVKSKSSSRDSHQYGRTLIRLALYLEGAVHQSRPFLDTYQA